MGGPLRTPKLSLADAGGTPSCDIVTTFALFLIFRLPLAQVLYVNNVSGDKCL